VLSTKLEARNSKAAFSLIEILVALGGLVVLSVLAISFFFLTLTQRDEAVAESSAVEQTEAAFALVGRAVRAAQTITVSEAGTRLELTGASECWLFDWDEINGELKYGRTQGSSCSLPAGADERVTSQTAEIENVSFSLLAPDDSSRSIEMTLGVAVFRPLASSQQTFSQVFVNVVDERGEEDD